MKRLVSGWSWQLGFWLMVILFVSYFGSMHGWFPAPYCNQWTGYGC